MNEDDNSIQSTGTLKMMSLLPSPFPRRNTPTPSDRSLLEKLDSQRLSLSQSLERPMLVRKRWKGSTISGTTLIRGDLSSGTIKKSTRVLIRKSTQPNAPYPSPLHHFSSIDAGVRCADVLAETINDSLKRRTSRNVHEERRKTTSDSELLSMKC